ncbi:MAG: hypothetical protein VXY07_12970, partial [Planctomycetota bacterium]|nr:hypothetical protein [Planctomycetota bacterium]
CASSFSKHPKIAIVVLGLEGQKINPWSVFIPECRLPPAHLALPAGRTFRRAIWAAVFAEAKACP